MVWNQIQVSKLETFFKNNILLYILWYLFLDWQLFSCFLWNKQTSLKLILCESLPKQLHLSLIWFIYHPIRHIQRQTTPESDPLSHKCSKRADKAGLRGTVHPWDRGWPFIFALGAEAFHGLLSLFPGTGSLTADLIVSVLSNTISLLVCFCGNFLEYIFC